MKKKKYHRWNKRQLYLYSEDIESVNVHKEEVVTRQIGDFNIIKDTRHF